MKNYTEDFQSFSLNEMAKAMRDMREKILDDLIGIIEESGLEAVAHSSRIHIQPADDLEDIAVIGFIIGADRMEFSLTVLGKRVPSQPGRNDYSIFRMCFDEEGYKEYKAFRQLVKRELENAKRAKKVKNVFGK